VKDAIYVLPAADALKALTDFEALGANYPYVLNLSAINIEVLGR